MDLFPDILTRGERAVLTLRQLYEGYGYRRYRIEKFEPYDLYRENRNFLNEETAITFPDSRGRLMALKPDVTMSIVKSYEPGAVPAKWHYAESVFRRGRGGDFREIRQIGIESLGGDPLYAQAEVLLLALRSLAVFSGDFVLALGHLGLLARSLEGVPLTEAVLNCVRHRNLHDLMRLIGEEQARPLTQLMRLPQEPDRALETIREVFPDRGAEEELSELETLCGILEASGLGGHLRLDFSVVQGLDYYNGLFFQGFVNGLPRPVLSGGRYDNLLEKLGKPSAAVGFAVYLAELDALFRDGPRPVDVALVNECPDLRAVLGRVEAWVREGLRVRVCRSRAEAGGAASVRRIDAAGEIREEGRS